MAKAYETLPAVSGVQPQAACKQASPRAFYTRLAWGNVRRSREVYGPYFLAVTILACVYFLILALVFSPGLKNVPGGETAQAVFSMSIALFTLFSFFFMLYINAFLIRRRKREFGLYSVLGMNKAHVARVLRQETLIVMGGGLLAGMLLGVVLGRLLFMLLLALMQAAVAGSTFQIPPVAFFGTLLLFLASYVATGLYNALRLRIANAVELLKGEKKGEKDSRLVIPAAILGVLLLGGTYVFANIIENKGLAVSVFFPLAFLVIIATYLLFHAGSIALLRLLRRNRRVYYKPENFIAISGMFHRMRQNARGLATICIFCTMLVVTIAGTTSLYLGQEEVLKFSYPYDVRIDLKNEKASPVLDTVQIDGMLGALAAEHGVSLSAAYDERILQLTNEPYSDDFFASSGRIWHSPAMSFARLKHGLVIDDILYVDIIGSEESGVFFVEAVEKSFAADVAGYRFVVDVFRNRREVYALFGGLLFMGVFFAVLFLSMAVLMVYFKQITEGYEDQERFSIMQKVGMRDDEVKKTIDRQILWVFFLPLGMTICHTLAAGKIIAVMLGAFGLQNTSLTYICIVATGVLFSLVYFFVYRRTANVYYRIVSR